MIVGYAENVPVVPKFVIVFALGTEPPILTPLFWSAAAVGPTRTIPKLTSVIVLPVTVKGELPPDAPVAVARVVGAASLCVELL